MATLSGRRYFTYGALFLLALLVIISPFIYTHLSRVQGEESLIKADYDDPISPTLNKSALLQDEDAIDPTSRPRFGRVSMIYGDVPPVYEKAVENHAHYAARYGYEEYILRRPVAEGFWSKTFYLVALLVNELAKPQGQRLEWLMWFDADTLIMNEAIPLDIFVPPTPDPLFDDIYFVASRDAWGLNSGSFFIRVHHESIRILTEAYVYCISHPDANLGRAFDQVALEIVLQRPEMQRHILWTPATWFNCPRQDYSPGSSIFLVHFWYNFDSAEKVGYMEEYLRWLEEESQQGQQVPYEQTFYPTATEKFWHWVQEAQRTLQEAQDFLAGEHHDDDDDDSQNKTEVFEDSRTQLEDMLVHSDSYIDLGPQLEEIKQNVSAALTP